MKITKDIFYHMYHIENLTIAEIANKFKLSPATISYYKKKFNIADKTNKNTKQIDKELLYDLYIKQHKKISEISKIINSNNITVAKYLKIFGIDIRNVSDYNKLPRVEFSPRQYEFFDGLMISDGSLTICHSGNRNRNAKISCGFKHKEFAEYIDKFLCLDGNIHKKIHKSARYVSGECIQYGLMSKNNILFTEERQRWYPDGYKIIPPDFRFSSYALNIAYLCDGNIHNGAAHLSLNSFTTSNIKNTIGRGLDTLNINFSIHKNNVLRITKSHTMDFLHYIGECPVECYKYKWKI